MNTTRDGQCEKREDIAGGDPETWSSGSRRAMLGAAAGGFALAASGLLLPEWLVEEAAADDHPLRGVQDRKQHKRDKGRHKREHNRRLKRRRNAAQVSSTSSGLMKGIQFTVNSRAGSYPVAFYVHPEEWFSTKFKLAETKTVSPGNTVIMQTDDQFGALWIEGRYYLAAVNYISVLPDMNEWAGLWGRIDTDNGWVDGTEYLSTDLVPTTRTIDGSAPVMQDDLRYVHFLRRPDQGNFKRLEVLIQPKK